MLAAACLAAALLAVGAAQAAPKKTLRFAFRTAESGFDPQKVYDWIDELDEKPTLVRMPDTSHFFHRRLMDLRGAIKNGVRKNLPPPRRG